MSELNMIFSGSHVRMIISKVKQSTVVEIWQFVGVF